MTAWPRSFFKQRYGLVIQRFSQSIVLTTCNHDSVQLQVKSPLRMSFTRPGSTSSSTSPATVAFTPTPGMSVPPRKPSFSR
ncbi:hypothetical protein BAUCODRAFT_30670 [Baudoinia panamericana UAMH 10762]|uniref:Uncharacterized protein n=1 Tax=Baudoinia panamericana (strain UAMH 10762) TaxID=717646 RepID=M2NL53_BAUPA|nr:uncharacterized protein BAUCODRAFT_30670 [Baudoinia panamericana UAMH 10762]EMD00205.1 hypothetical protein BAUCODRAFT_30670 [Baudoinia panamericana UAMH 10762]